LPLRVEQVVQDVNRFLQGGAGYFRYGSSAREFDAITAHAIRRLSIYIASRHGRARGYGRHVLLLARSPRLDPPARHRPPAPTGGASQRPAECRR
jgi:hypothetical protein